MVLEEYLPWVPYELIGQIAVGLFLLIIGAAILAATITILYAAWYRGLTLLANKIHEGRDLEDPKDRPPVWQVRIAGLALGLRNLDLHGAFDAYSKADELTENDSAISETLSDIRTYIASKTVMRFKR